MNFQARRCLMSQSQKSQSRDSATTAMSAELAHQKADMHLYVALHIKVRIRLHPSIETNCGITNILDGSLPNVASIRLFP